MDLSSIKSIANHPYREQINGNSIRLFRISSSRDGGFCGILKVFSLLDAPPFYSASYTWGERIFSDTTIKFKSSALPVLPSLVPFLHMITKHADFNGKDWWWIDSLSINLADSQERKQQIQIMADIYSRAKKVIIWLGEEKEEGSDCTGAVDFMLYLSTLSLAFDHHQIIRQNLRGPKFINEWASVSNILARPWWSRVWTLQEFILPKEAKFCCGSHSISRGRFKSAMYSIFLCSKAAHDLEHELVPRPLFDAAFNRRRIHQWHTSPQSRGMSLVAILAYLGNQSASDPRDRIYSVLGLMTERDKRIVGEPEYTTSIQHQFAKLVRSFWNEYLSLDIICFSHLFNRYSDAVDSGPETATPSWTPDWRVHTEFASPVPLMASQSANEHIGNFRPLHSTKWRTMYDAPGPQLRPYANVTFIGDLKEIMCDGVVVDTINHLGALEGCDPRCKSFVCAGDEQGHGILHSTQDMKNTYSPNPFELLDSIARSLVLDRQDKYLRFQAPDHYVSDFLGFCHACMNGDPSVDSTFSTWFQQNRTLRFGNYTLESLITAITCNADPTVWDSFSPPMLRRVSMSSNPLRTSTEAEYYDADSFLSRFQDTTKKKSRRLMVTTDGYVGMAPCRARLGDAVMVLFGCSIPLVLRCIGQRAAWQVIGEAYIHDFMNGEIIKRVEQGDLEVFSLRLV